jgi:hypothetical protein
MAKIFGTCGACGTYSHLYMNRSATGNTDEVCESCFLPEDGLFPAKRGTSVLNDINCDEDFEFWAKVDWESQAKLVQINHELSINCFDTNLSSNSQKKFDAPPPNMSVSEKPKNIFTPKMMFKNSKNETVIFPPSSSVIFKNTKIGELAWFQPTNQNLGWSLFQNLDWMPVGLGFLSNYGWSGDYEKTRERARLLIKQEKFSNILHSRIQSLHHESAEVGLVGLMPTTWAEISYFAQTDLRHLLVSEGARIGSENKSSLKSERKTVFFDTESLRVPLIMFAATMLLEYLHFEDMYMNESGDRT